MVHQKQNVSGCVSPPCRCPRCDLKTRRPRKTYVALYDRVCEEIAGMGLAI